MWFSYIFTYCFFAIKLIRFRIGSILNFCDKEQRLPAKRYTLFRVVQKFRRNIPNGFSANKVPTIYIVVVNAFFRFR